MIIGAFAAMCRILQGIADLPTDKKQTNKTNKNNNTTNKNKARAWHGVFAGLSPDFAGLSLDLRFAGGAKFGSPGISTSTARRIFIFMFLFQLLFFRVSEGS